ncbi:tyrosine-type recombinase/integrase [Candidatus Babeliales bacterium]|nr:tyrosine-type recombinase/integrase [Candidatus Babeliales bacterium]MCF7899444.1 tyrosine-type recombinase/integrase [Candidatus Babeliales bacterium]
MSTSLNLNKFEEKIKDFLSFLEIEKNVSPNTLRAYKIDLQQIIKFWKNIEKKSLESKESKNILSFDKIIRRYILALFYKKISKATLARKISCLRSFMLFLESFGIKLKLNLKAPRIDKKLPITLSVDEIFYLLDNIKNEDLPTSYPYRDKSIFELIYATGVRCSEIVGIKFCDIDFENKLIKVFGKGKKERIVLFGKKAQDSLKKYLEIERPILLGNTNSSDYLFLNYTGTNLTSRSVQRIFEMFRKFLKIDRKLTPHKIRHSFATHLLSQGVDLRVIQELLGHQTIATTEIYTQVSSAQLAKMCDEKHPLNKFDSLIKI